MTEKIICCIIAFGCAILFYSIGIYAHKREKPMWFWSDSEVNASQITDVKGYNKENGVMWKLYSIWFVVAGLAGIWNSVAYLIVLVLSCAAGIPLLVRSYNKILEKYRVQ